MRIRCFVRKAACGLALGMVLAGLPWTTGGSPVHADILPSLFNALAADGGVAAEPDVAYGPHPRHRLDVYRPANGVNRAPVVVFFYGGGWTDGARATYRFAGAAFAARGYTTVVPDYRLFPEVKFPAFLDDAARAYRWAHATFKDACGRPRPIVVVGHSAGAYIGAMLAHDPARRGDGRAIVPAPAAFIGLAGPYAFDPTTWPSTRDIFAPAAGAPDRARPITFAAAGAPPSLLLHGGADETVKLYNTRDFAAALSANGNVARVVEYPGVGHAGLVTSLARGLRWRAPALADTVAFIERHAAATPCR
jgi:acetyl esterase/lipase